VRQRHLHDSGVDGGRLAAQEALFLKKLRLGRDKGRVDMEQLGHDVDRNAVILVQVGQGHQNHPLRTADPKRFRPELAQLIEVYIDRRDLPHEAPDLVLILGGSALSLLVSATSWGHRLFLLCNAYVIFNNPIMAHGANENKPIMSLIANTL